MGHRGNKMLGDVGFEIIYRFGAYSMFGGSWSLEANYIEKRALSCIICRQPLSARRCVLCTRSLNSITHYT